MRTFKDKAGHVVKAGDFIVYATTEGRNAEMKYAKVIDVVERNQKWSAATKTTALRIVAVTRRWDGRNDDGKINETTVLQSKSLIEVSARILKLSREQVTAEALKLLDTVDPETY